MFAPDSVPRTEEIGVGLPVLAFTIAVCDRRCLSLWSRATGPGQ